MQGLDAIERIVAAAEAEAAQALRKTNVYQMHQSNLEHDRLMADWVVNRTRQLLADPRFAARQSARDKDLAERRAATLKRLDAERATEELRAHYRAASDPARLWTRIARLEEELAQREAVPPPEEAPAPETSAPQGESAAAGNEVPRLQAEIARLEEALAQRAPAPPAESPARATLKRDGERSFRFLRDDRGRIHTMIDAASGIQFVIQRDELRRPIGMVAKPA